MYVRCRATIFSQVIPRYMQSVSAIYHKYSVCTCMAYVVRHSGTSFICTYIFAYSVTVKVGEDDYWSTRMAEFTGKPNRVVFDETLEKIYSRLYTNAKQMR